MQSASRTMYIIGRVFCIIGILLAITLIVLGSICKANTNEIAEYFAKQGYTKYDSVKEVSVLGTFALVGGIVLLVFELAEFILATKASSAVAKGTKEQWPHILLIVIGVLGNLFFALGGIFGLIQSENKSNKN